MKKSFVKKSEARFGSKKSGSVSASIKIKKKDTEDEKPLKKVFRKG